jgi:hypothetical protein
MKHAQVKFKAQSSKFKQTPKLKQMNHIEHAPDSFVVWSWFLCLNFELRAWNFFADVRRSLAVSRQPLAVSR